MLTFALTAVLLQAAPPVDEHAGFRKWLIEQHQEVDLRMSQDMDNLDRTGGPPKPLLGLRLEVVEKGGNPPLRTTLVAGILPGSPAEKAGIREGDRLLAIGSKTLEHESGKAVLLYLSDYPKAVPLTILRGTTRRNVVVRRRVIPCLAKAHAAFETELWHQRLAHLRDILARQAADLPQMGAEDLQQVSKNLQRISSLSAEMLKIIALDRGHAMAIACVPLQ